MEHFRMVRGARIIMRDWVKVHPGDKICLVTSVKHYSEVRLLQNAAEDLGGVVSILFVEQEGIHVGDYFDMNPQIFRPYDVIIGASDYSIITTKAAEIAVSSGKKMLSLPLSVNHGESMLGFDFITMDVDETRILAETAMGMIGHPSSVHITTALGTDLTFSMAGRDFTFFNGTFWPHHNFSSASFEICIPIVETATEGTLVCDGSFGYIGKVKSPVQIHFSHGRIDQIDDSPEGRRLADYIASYHNERMLVGGELGIGLNDKSRCAGECYIEDESTYGTFHIGLGRNIGLGGRQNASGHFDLVTWHPTISFDGRMVMKDGCMLMPE